MQGCEGCQAGDRLAGDDIADGAALVTALMDRDAEAARVVLTHGCPPGVALFLAGRLAVALRGLDSESAAVIIGGWRRDAEDRRAARPPAKAGD